MNALPKKLLPLILCAIAVTTLFSVQPARAFTVTINQVGANVVATGTGAFNLTGLTFFGNVSFSAGNIGPASAIIHGGGNGSLYSGLTGPGSFGIGGQTLSNSFSGPVAGLTRTLSGFFLAVPIGYVSGTALSDMVTFNNATFASLGATPGTYVWSWGRGANQNFTLVIGGAGVPDGGATVSLLGCALLGLAALRRKLGC